MQQLKPKMIVLNKKCKKKKINVASETRCKSISLRQDYFYLIIAMTDVIEHKTKIS